MPIEVLPALTALADATRLEILINIGAAVETRTRDLQDALDLSQPNLSRHLKQLVAAKLVSERRAGDTNKIYALDNAGIASCLEKVAGLLAPANARASLSLASVHRQRQQALAAVPAALHPFLDAGGRVAHFSTKRAEQMLVLDYLISKVAPGRNYSERELTALIGEWLSPNVRQGAAAATFAIDAVTLRRALVEESQLQRTRDGRSYWRDQEK